MCPIGAQCTFFPRSTRFFNTSYIRASGYVEIRWTAHTFRFSPEGLPAACGTNMIFGSNARSCPPWHPLFRCQTDTVQTDPSRFRRMPRWEWHRFLLPSTSFCLCSPMHWKLVNMIEPILIGNPDLATAIAKSLQTECHALSPALIIFQSFVLPPAQPPSFFPL